MALLDFAGDAGEVDALDTRGGPLEIGVDDFAVQTDRFENLRAAVTLDGRDAHLRHRFDDAFDRGFDVLLDGFRDVDAGEILAADDVLDRFEDQIRIDRARAVTGEQSEMVHFARFAGLEDEADLRACAIGHEMVVQPGHGEQRGYSRLLLAGAAVGKDKNVDAAGDGLVGGFEEFV